MTNFQAAVLGVVQGLTEYLPVSSSAHLVIVPSLLGWEFSEQESFIFDVLVQLGTLVGIFLYFFEPIKRVMTAAAKGIVTLKPFADKEAQMGYLVVLATIPAALVGLLCKSYIAGLFSSAKASYLFLIVTGGMLILAEFFHQITRVTVSTKDALLMGAAQTLALLPGISRSGSTISAGMMAGLSRKEAAQFSFLMSIPVMFGASLVAVFDLMNASDLLLRMAKPLAIGFFTAAITGYLVIRWFMQFISHSRLFPFAAYCILLGCVGLFVL